MTRAIGVTLELLGNTEVEGLSDSALAGRGLAQGRIESTVKPRVLRRFLASPEFSASITPVRRPRFASSARYSNFIP